MKKLALDPETLKVQTFETSFVPEGRGTVMAAGTSACAFTDCTCEPMTPCCWHDPVIPSYTSGLERCDPD